MSTAVGWLRQNRFAVVGALLGGALIGLIAAPLAFGGGVIGFATGITSTGASIPDGRRPNVHRRRCAAINRAAAVV
jgi:hypothetical protein